MVSVCLPSNIFVRVRLTQSKRDIQKNMSRLSQFEPFSGDSSRSGEGLSWVRSPFVLSLEKESLLAAVGLYGGVLPIERKFRLVTGLTGRVEDRSYSDISSIPGSLRLECLRVRIDGGEA